jgi:hypothetical protein
VIRELWQLVKQVFDPETWAAMMDDWTHCARENTGQDPDPKVEARRARRYHPDHRKSRETLDHKGEGRCQQPRS